MIKLLMALVLSTTLLGCSTAEAKRKVSKSKVPTITLRANNSVTLRGVVSFDSVKTAQKKLLELSSTLPKKAIIYLILDTPGGSISAGMELIQVAKAIPQRVITVTNFAASMGFVTAQFLGSRYVLPHGTLMSHRAWARISGQVPGELNTRLKNTMRMVNDIERTMARRMKMSTRAYKRLIFPEYWTYGSHAVKEGAADKVVKAVCDHTLLGTEKEKVRTLFGSVNVTWSKCPLITSPVNVDFNDIDIFTDSEDIAKLRNFISSMYSNDKKLFFEEYMKTRKYTEFLR